MNNFTSQLNKVVEALPSEYDKQVLLDLYKQFYPNQWSELIGRYEYYRAKDEQLVSVGKKRRYYHKSPINFFYSLAKVKLICSDGYRLKHKNNYIEENRVQAVNYLKAKIQKPKCIPVGLQFTDPYHLDIFISAYNRHGSTQNEKIEIVNELKKFKTKETIIFFQKINDAERNTQIRNMAFEHLQSIGAYVQKRRGFKGKKKDYYHSTDKFIVTPADLADRLKCGGIQSKKEFDVFISHSYKDNKLVNEVMVELNKHGLSIYCDWTSDNDFLRRNLASEYTEIVLKARLSQSKYVLFLQTDNSVDCGGDFLSKWVKMELDHAIKNGKDIFCINVSSQLPLFSEVTSSADKYKLTTDEANKLRIQ